ncbi:hypothetical protein RvY_04150 [Ramazzottius varieornatus]|uniref:Uncharacterized protein n=1 Tax=Ramazzottius varieornatus TaxID=947166 RepID=A0A1D1V0P0_RAMVA|nr:hypothetical protein RvY_04150 [Ramazzottius varieornatus]
MELECYTGFCSTTSLHITKPVNRIKGSQITVVITWSRGSKASICNTWFVPLISIQTCQTQSARKLAVAAGQDFFTTCMMAVTWTDHKRDDKFVQKAQ